MVAPPKGSALVRQWIDIHQVDEVANRRRDKDLPSALNGEVGSLIMF